MLPPQMEAAYGHEELERRLLEHRRVEDIRPDLEPCWLWSGSHDSGGYGRITLAKVSPGRFSVHRVAAALWLPEFELSSNLIILHECDTPSCFNPAHLRPGTSRDNTLDALAKGRLTRPPVLHGEANGNAKTTTFCVAMMRKQYADGAATQAELAQRFRISVEQVARIVRGEDWKLAPGPITRSGRVGGFNRMAKLTDADVIEMRYLADLGLEVRELQDRFKVCDTTVRRILAGRAWRHLPMHPLQDLQQVA